MSKNRKSRMPEIGTPSSLVGITPESWLCVDCGINTAPGMLNRVEMERAFAQENSSRTTHTPFRMISPLGQSPALYALPDSSA